MRSHKHDTTQINAQTARSRRGTNHWGSLFVFWISVKNCTPLFNLQSPESVVRPSTEPQKLSYSSTHLKGGAKRHLNSKKNRDSPSLHPCPLARLTPLRWTVDESHLLPWFCHRPGGRGPLCGPKAPFYFIQLSSACSQWHNARTRQFFSPSEHASSNLHKAWYVLMLYPCLKHIALHLLLHSQVAASQRPTWKGHFASTTCHGHPSRAPKQTRCIPWPYSYHWPCPFSQ